MNGVGDKTSGEFAGNKIGVYDGGGQLSGAIKNGSFSIVDWNGYPIGGVKPTGPFRLLDGVEYNAARKLANSTNAAMHRANPMLKGIEIHEIHPVKFGGSPTDISNKIFLTPSEHIQYTNFWNGLLRNIKKY